MGKFIRSRVAYEFENPETGEKYKIPREYLGEVPDWVAKTALYKLATSGKNPTISTVGAEKKKTEPSGISDEEKALRAKGKALKIPDYSKLSLMELAVAIDKIENPTQGTTAPGTGDEEKADTQTPPEQ